MPLLDFLKSLFSSQNQEPEEEDFDWEEDAWEKIQEAFEPPPEK